MTISVRNDCYPAASGGGGLSMRNSPAFAASDLDSKGFLARVREPVAIARFRDFRERFFSDVNWLRVQRDIIQAMGSEFGLRTQAARDVFDEIWPILENGRRYIKNRKNDIQNDLVQAYGMLAQVAAGDPASALPGNPATWVRIRDMDLNAGQKTVVFSDHHMTAFSDGAPLRNYFHDYNYALYLDVLDHYDAEEAILVENGDVEETIICELSLVEAQNRKSTATNGIGGIHNFPIRRDDQKWQDYLAMKGSQRRIELDRITAKFETYYQKIATRFQQFDRYVRLTGNHDTYLWRDSDEALMAQSVSDALGGAAISDILRISRNGVVQDIVMHGHQFDTVCIQHGDVPWALSGGELYSESSAWCYQGPDRFWDDWQCEAWRNGKEIENALVVADYSKDGAHDALDLFTAGPNALARIAANRPDKSLEGILQQNIGWSHFRNKNAFHALALEVASGQTMFKFRHLDEIALVSNYRRECILRGIVSPPRVTLGHTHEPRQMPSRVYRHPVTKIPTREIVDFYANSGSAGRFSNLIWCVELLDGAAQVVSWSRENGVATRREWHPSADPGSLAPSRLVPA